MYWEFLLANITAIIQHYQHYLQFESVFIFCDTTYCHNVSIWMIVVHTVEAWQNPKPVGEYISDSISFTIRFALIQDWLHFIWTSSENEASSLLFERVVTLLGKSLHEDIIVSMLLHVLHDLGDRLRYGHAMNAGLHSQLFHQLTLCLQSFLELAHHWCRCTLPNNTSSAFQLSWKSR